jgi:hypothetical protein
VGEGKESARAQVLAARALLDEELVRLEASARAAVDIPAKVRRNPGKSAGIAAATGFVVLGGPKRVLRGARNAIFGTPDPLPKSMLPKEIERAVKELGTDGARVRGTLEREFAAFVEERTPDRKSRNLAGVIALLLTSVGLPVAQRYGRELAEQLFSPDENAYKAQLAKVRARVADAADAAAAAATKRTPSA